MSDALTQALDGLSERVGDIDSRVRRIEGRLLKWGAVVLFGVEGMRFALPFIVAAGGVSP